MRVGVEITSAYFDASGTVRKFTTAWLPVVTSDSLPLATSNDPTFALPSLTYTLRMLRPSADHTGGLPPPPRGAVLSPVKPPAISKSKFAVRFRGFALAARSITHRSGCVYERTGWLTVATNATCLPSGLTTNPNAPMSNDVSFEGSPPVTVIV